MAALCGILGKRDPAVVQRMAKALAHRGEAAHTLDGQEFSIASSSPIGATPCLLDGAPRDKTGALLSPDDLAKRCAGVNSPAELSLRDGFAAVLQCGETWWLLRDRLGRKPLYFFQGDGHLLFASELKALLHSGLVPKHLNLTSVDQYLTLRCVPGPESIIRGVYRVRPGHVVAYTPATGCTMTRFSGFQLETTERSREQAIAGIRDHLQQALEKSDGDALLWSSGLDCAALAALAPTLKPLFVSLERSWQDEARVAKESARRMRRPLEIEKARRMTEEAFAKVAGALDEPIVDASVLPLWLILQAAAEHGPNLLSGHGADELLGGYPRYHFLQRAQGAHSLVPTNLITGILPALPPNAFVRRSSRYLASIHDNLQAYLCLLAVFDDEERRNLYTDAMRSALHDLGSSVAAVRHLFDQTDLTRNLLALDLNVALPSILLDKCDRIGAAHGVSLSFPYLQDDLVDFVTSLPPEVKFGVRSKPLLRIGMKGRVPPRIRLRARRGFRIPQGGRLVRVIDNVARQVITPDRVDATGIFKWHYVEQVLRSASHNVYRRRQFWALLLFFAWYREMMEA